MALKCLNVVYFDEPMEWCFLYLLSTTGKIKLLELHLLVNNTTAELRHYL